MLQRNTVQLSPATAHLSPVALLPPVETRWQRLAFLLLATLITVGFFCITHRYWAPAHPGVDQNGYLVGGRMLADHGSTALTPTDPYAFVGRMWISTRPGEFHPKYPAGLPLLYALCLRLSGPTLAYWLSPIAMTLAVAGTCLLLRRFLPPFPALLGALIVASSPVALGLTNNPNSHAAALCCVVWGMALLTLWWERGGLLLASGAGFLLGYAVTIRYSEGLLVLPLGVVLLYRFAPRDWRYWRDAAGALLAWALPVALLLAFNLRWFGALTGYDPTNESTGFRWEYFRDNWETMLRTMHNTALFFVFPFAAAGLLLMFWSHWRAALFLASWSLPSLLLYTAYYWAPEGSVIGYSRFFLTVLPALALPAAWLFTRLAASPAARAAAGGLAVAVACGVAVWTATGLLEQDHRVALSLDLATREVRRVAPPSSVVFGEDRLLHHLQFTADYHLYGTEPFARQTVLRLMYRRQNPDDPQTLQPQRAQALYDLLKDETDSQLIRRQGDLMTAALADGQRVFFVGSPRAVTEYRLRYANPRLFQTRVLSTWQEAPAPARTMPTDGFRGWRGWDRARQPVSAFALQSWQVLEVTARSTPEPTKPAVTPSVTTTTRTAILSRRDRRNER